MRTHQQSAHKLLASARLLWIVGVLVSAANAQTSADGRVTIEGGPDATRHQYTWTVSNRHRSPIVRVEFAHYNADLFFVPDGWSTEGTTNLVNVGVTEPNGMCVGVARSPALGIAFRNAAEFRARVAPPGATTGKGQWRLRFADGSESIVHGVPVPVAPVGGDRYVSLVGLALVFAILVAAESVRRRRQRA